MPTEHHPAVNWREVAESIANGEAILVLGPGAIPLYRAKSSDNPEDREEPPVQSYSQLTRRRILQAEKEVRVAYFYERENLFLFQDSESKRNALKIMRDSARDKRWLPDQELMRQIAAIPFCLVMDINPDTCLRDTFIQYGLSPQFDYFTAKDKPEQVELKPLTAERPLLYNLCGCVEKLDSQILDYNDLFDLLRNMLSDLGVPQTLRAKLQEADRFVLLGLQLERWYFQLFLHYLNKLDTTPFDNPTKNFSILNDIQGDTREFVLRQFNLECIAPSRSAFDELYTACADLGILRKLADPLSAGATEVRIRVEQNDFDTAFTLLEKNTVSLDASELSHLKSRYTHWRQQSEQGTALTNELDVELNRIRYALLTYAAQIPQ